MKPEVPRIKPCKMKSDSKMRRKERRSKERQSRINQKAELLTDNTTLGYASIVSVLVYLLILTEQVREYVCNNIISLINIHWKTAIFIHKFVSSTPIALFLLLAIILLFKPFVMKRRPI